MGVGFDDLLGKNHPSHLNSYRAPATPWQNMVHFPASVMEAHGMNTAATKAEL